MNEQAWHCDSQWHRSQACNRSRWPSRPITRLRTGSVALRIQAPVCDVEVYWLRPKVWRMFVCTMNLIHMNRQWNTKWRKPYITVVVEEVYIETGTKQADVSAVCVCVHSPYTGVYRATYLMSWAFISGASLIILLRLCLSICSNISRRTSIRMWNCIPTSSSNSSSSSSSQTDTSIHRVRTNIPKSDNGDQSNKQQGYHFALLQLCNDVTQYLSSIFLK